MQTKSSSDIVSDIIKQAYLTGGVTSPSWEDYEFYKSLLPRDLTHTEYERAVRQIADALGI